MESKNLQEAILNKALERLSKRYGEQEIKVKDAIETIIYCRVNKETCKDILIKLEEKKLVERINRDNVRVVAAEKEDIK